MTPLPRGHWSWRIQFFQRDSSEDPERSVPTIEFFDELSDTVVAEFQAILDAVAAGPPPSFSGGGKWEAMRGDMAGFFEVRVSGSDRFGKRLNHRLFCLLVRDDPRLGGPAIVCIGGLSKPLRTAAHPRDYRRIRQLGDEFKLRGTVLQ
jgi:hypothetical protein